MKAFCNADCDKCGFKESKNCKGCLNTGGCPFGRECFIARYIKLGGHTAFFEFKNQLLKEINGLSIEGLPKIDELFPLNGEYVNLAYPLPSGENIKLLKNDDIYLGNQVRCEFDDGEGEKCFGIVANQSFILICEYGENGSKPEIVLFKRR